jgi:hypothetical protein
MGQTASKVAASLTGRSATASSRAAVPHIPSIPGKSGRPGQVVVDPLTGFTRGTAPLLPAEEQQRQFLEAKQGTRRDPVTGQPLPFPDKMPDDLLQFLNDMGPVQSRIEPRPQTQGHRPSRAPRLSGSETNEASTNDDTTVSSTTAVPAKPGHDPTRHVVAMPLAEQIPQYETQRTTSFSVTPEAAMEPDPIGANAIQIFCLLSGKTSIQSHLSATTAGTPPTSSSSSSEVASSVVDPELQSRMEQALQYIQTPVLLKDLEDGGYVGAWPDRVAELQKAHDRLIALDTKTRAKLVLEDLWDMEQRAAKAMAAKVVRSMHRGTSVPTL